MSTNNHQIFLHIAKIGESFGYVLAESLLCETPIITLNTPWADNSQSEVIGNRIGGFSVFKKRNFINAVQILINDKKLRLSFGSKGRKRIKSKYDHKVLSQKVIDKLINSSNLLNKKKVDSPYILTSDVIDSVDFLSKFLLVNEYGFYFLRLTTGYMSPLLFIILAIQKLLIKIKKKITLKFKNSFS